MRNRQRSDWPSDVGHADRLGFCVSGDAEKPMTGYVHRLSVHYSVRLPRAQLTDLAGGSHLIQRRVGCTCVWVGETVWCIDFVLGIWNQARQTEAGAPSLGQVMLHLFSKDC
jgi:hypothetical protein